MTTTQKSETCNKTVIKILVAGDESEYLDILKIIFEEIDDHLAVDIISDPLDVIKQIKK
jgi:hypothetical protein